VKTEQREAVLKEAAFYLGHQMGEEELVKHLTLLHNIPFSKSRELIQSLDNEAGRALIALEVQRREAADREKRRDLFEQR